jgi:hypothetical protein
MKYRCYECRGEFEATADDERTIADLERDFPNYSVEECGLVCDGCLAEGSGNSIRTGP